MTERLNDEVAELRRANAELQQRLDEALTERDEAAERETATAEVLQVINSSSGNLTPVFDTMLEKAMRLCEAAFGLLQIREGNHFRTAATRGVPAAFADFRNRNAPIQGPGSLGGRIMAGERIVHVVDLKDDEPYRAGDENRRALVDIGGGRTGLAVALVRDESIRGFIIIYRQDVRPFADQQIALLQNFAAQAVIAMENARLITETREALEQQTATAEVLEIISASPGHLEPVFKAVLANAVRICGGRFGILGLRDGDGFRGVAAEGVSREISDNLSRLHYPPPGTGLHRLQGTLATVQIADCAAESAYDPVRAANPPFVAVRTALHVPMLRERDLLGAILIYRDQVLPFTESEIELVENFAKQAAIAIENARLITETREALDQQTATAEVLGVINASPGDLTPVFEAMLEKAMRLCEASFGAFMSFDGDLFHRAAHRGLPVELVEENEPLRPVQGSALARIAGGGAVVHIHDLSDTDAYRAGYLGFVRLVEQGGARTAIWMALRKDDALLGVAVIYRQEVRPFTDKQIALLENFSAQAVIAMENARLITETREALDQQTATAEVLGVINSSPGNLAPVFDAMLEKAMRLCEADFGIMFIIDADHLHIVAERDVPRSLADYFDEEPPQAGPDTLLGQAIRARKILHTPDALDAEPYRKGVPLAVKTVELGGARALLMAPLLKDESVLGVFAIFRQDVRPFTDKQIALLQNFAAQAVIAMENARLITETREALDQQTATAEVLQAINSSPGDLKPVFDAMLEKATRLCGAAFGIMHVTEGEQFHGVATLGVPATYDEFMRQNPIPLAAAGIVARVRGGEPFIHNIDLQDHELYRRGDPQRRALVNLAGARSSLAVALRREQHLLGTIHIYRQEVRPFTDKQIALLQNFAAQAVIAMENARLIIETREALEQQTATSEVLAVINSSPGDLAPVFDAMLEKAMHLCEAKLGFLSTFDGQHFDAVAMYGVPEAYAAEYFAKPYTPASGTTHARIVNGEDVVHVTDLIAEGLDSPRRRAVIEMLDARTILGVALRKDGALLGALHVYRQEVRPFSDKQIALLQNFAAQAVIAMENARLFGELRQRTDDLQESLEYQTATGDVLKVISGSAFELAPVLQTVVSTAVRLCRADQATIYRLEDGEYRWAADHSLAPDYERIERNVRIRPSTGTLVGRVALDRNTVQILDAWTDPLYEVKEDARVGGVHTMLGVPLLREGLPIGVIGLARRRIEPYTEKEIELVRTFADQAVIAIENARLLAELRSRTDELAQRQAELRVTFDNMADGVVMFDEDLRLAAWNRNFQELLDLPDAVLADRPSYADYLRTLAERGEFGTEDIEAELSRRLESTDQELRLERARPDGRVIEVRRNAVPDGGFVLIYSDITERKRSEAEIRAARDAAEATLRDLRAAQANLIQAEKMASLGQLTAGIAHEIKNPLNFVNNFASLSVELLDELKETTAPAISTLGEDKRAEIDETMVMLTGNLEKIAEHGKRADNMVKSMLEHSRGGAGERRSVDLNDLIEEALNLAYHGARAQDQTFNITLDRDFGRGIAPIELVPQDITRVCLNLFGNGFYAATKRVRSNEEPGFQPVLQVATRDLGDAVEVRVRDNGDGIPAEIRDKLFQPFFTTKPTGEGTGLGLSISYDIITQQHGGTITVESEPGSFTEFTVRLPRQ